MSDFTETSSSRTLSRLSFVRAASSALFARTAISEPMLSSLPVTDSGISILAADSVLDVMVSSCFLNPSSTASTSLILAVSAATCPSVSLMSSCIPELDFATASTLSARLSNSCFRWALETEPALTASAMPEISVLSASISMPVPVAEAALAPTTLISFLVASNARDRPAMDSESSIMDLTLSLIFSATASESAWPWISAIFSIFCCTSCRRDSMLLLLDSDLPLISSRPSKSPCVSFLRPAICLDCF